MTTSSSSHLPLVLVVGATGHMGRHIVKGLAYSRKFRVVAMVRPSSLSKASLAHLKACGVEIRVGDLADGVEKLKTVLAGVSVLVSAVGPRDIAAQRDIIRAAHMVGVQRVVPSEFAPPGAEGVWELRDAKLAIRQFIRDLGVPHTFVDAGWAMQTFLPLPPRSKAPPAAATATHTAFMPGDARVLLADMQAVGAYVARVVADPRTLGRKVIVWDDERPVSAAHAAGERLSGEAGAMRALRRTVSEAELARISQEARTTLARDPAHPDAARLRAQLAWAGLVRSACVLRENTLENARRLGYMDARALYPDVRQCMLEEFAGRFYRLKEPGEAWL